MSKISSIYADFARNLLLDGRCFGPTPEQITAIAYTAQWLADQAQAGFTPDTIYSMPNDKMPAILATRRGGKSITVKAFLLQAMPGSVLDAVLTFVFGRDDEALALAA